ncbi:MAG: hypothetical protein QW566_05325 [Candidatus Jordarchaeales archaeon]
MVIVSPSLVKVTWEARSTSIGETLKTTARFTEEKGNETIRGYFISFYPYYDRQLNEWRNTYDYAVYVSPWKKYDVVKDVVITGNLIERHYPPRSFNAYMYEEELIVIGLEEEDFKSKDYYYLAGSRSFTYNFRITFDKRDKPIIINIVVEVPKDDLNPNVSADELSRNVEINIVTTYTKIIENWGNYVRYYSCRPLSGVSKIRNAILHGSVREINSHKFNFHIYCNKLNYMKNETAIDWFSIPLTEEQVGHEISFTVENIDYYDETVLLEAEISYEVEVTDYSASTRTSLLGSFLSLAGSVVTVFAIIMAIVSKSKVAPALPPPPPP